MEDEEAELRNPFPSPPSHYTNYTVQNLRLLSLLKARSADLDTENADQAKVLSDQDDIPEWPLTDLEKPRVDWILEDGSYTVFGDTWFVKEAIPSLGELGGHQLYPADPSVDRRPALMSILRSLLASYSFLLRSLLVPPSIHESGAPEWQKHLEWMTVMGQNVISAANDLRPVQARDNIERMMKRQLELRREETRMIHEKCDALEAKIAALQASALSDLSASGSAAAGQVNASPSQAWRTITSTDVLRWAEEV